MRLLTLARDLTRRKARERQGLFAAEGVRSVRSLLESDLKVRGLLLREAERSAAASSELTTLVERARARGVEVVTVSPAEFDSASDTESPQGVLAIGETPAWPALDAWDAGSAPRGTVLLLDALQDPGNVGTIIRTAAALGVCATIALPGTVDVWNAKVVRGAMGALFTHPVVAWTWEETRHWLTRCEMPLWVADADGEPLHALVESCAAMPRVALAVSNEGSGVTPAVRDAAERAVSIPMDAGSESLNVAVASGILLYALQQRASAPGARA
jgi:TrmH family RNA methyltransferase